MRSFEGCVGMAEGGMRSVEGWVGGWMDGKGRGRS